jgi:cation transport ATPase
MVGDGGSDARALAQADVGNRDRARAPIHRAMAHTS